MKNIYSNENKKIHLRLAVHRPPLAVSRLPSTIFVFILALCVSIQMQAQASWTIYNTSNSGLPYDNVYCTLPDGQGNLWVGTDYGLGYFDGQNWTTYRTDNSDLPHNSVRSLLLDENDDLWVGTFIGGLAKYDGIDWTVYNITNSGLEDNFIRSMVIDENATLWVGTSGGLHRLDGTVWQVYNIDNSNLMSNNIPTLAVDENNALWIGTINGGIARLQDTTMTVYTADNTLLTDNTILDIYIDEQQNKLLACPAGGLNILNPNANATAFLTLNSSICDNSISAIAELNGTIFLGTAPAGICTFGEWTSYNTDNSPLTNNTIRSLTPEGDSILWVAPDFGGLIRFKPDFPTVNQAVAELPDIRVYPNPAVDFIHINTPVHTCVRMYDVLGNMWYENEKILDSEAIPVQDLPTGIYFLELFFDGRKIIKRVLVN